MNRAVKLLRGATIQLASLRGSDLDPGVAAAADASRCAPNSRRWLTGS